MPNAFHLLNPHATTPLLIFGDHASRFIPDSYANLGLSGDDLTRHIAWDIGTDCVIKTLSEDLRCTAQLAGVSRLVIDLNRDPNVDTLIPQESDGTLITGNIKLSAQARKARLETYYTPYHAQLLAQFSRLQYPFFVSVHSFTPHPLTGDERDLDIGLLVKHDFASAEFFQKRAQDHTQLDIHINEPYSGFDLNYTVDQVYAHKAVRHLAIEINQRHISTDAAAKDMAKRLAPHILATAQLET